MRAEKVALGVDIGGTKVAAGLVNSCGRILFTTRVPMNAGGKADEAMNSVHDAIRASLDAANGMDLCGIGVASPGPLELSAGLVVDSPNLPCWRNFPLRDRVRDRYGYATRLDNDANAAGLAEALWGAGVSYNSVFYATLGTGIGTAIVLNQRLYYGRTGTAAEGGHMTIDLDAPCACGCGKRGCLEGLASGTAIARRTREKLLAGHNHSQILSLCGGDPAAVTAKTVATAWRGGDRLAQDILNETAGFLAVWLGNIVDLLEPEVLIVGGGLSKVMSEWFPQIKAQMPSWSINPRCSEIPLVEAKYGADAGIAGSAALCFSEPAALTVSLPAAHEL
jgi:glucokinase